MSKKAIIISIIVVLVLIAIYFIFMANSQVINQPENNQVDNNQQQNDTQLAGEPTVNDTPDTPINTGKTYEVTYTDAGYSPKEITINKGDTVVFKNQSSLGMWTASALHPSHVVYSGTSVDEHCPDTTNTSFDECKSDQPGSSWSFTFNKAGTWRYHNHVKSNHSGSVIVK